MGVKPAAYVISLSAVCEDTISLCWSPTCCRWGESSGSWGGQTSPFPCFWPHRNWCVKKYRYNDCCTEPCVWSLGLLLDGDTALKLIDNPKLADSTLMISFLFSHLGIPEDSCPRCRSLLAVFSPIRYCWFYRPTNVVTDPRAASSCSLVRKTVNWTKGVYLIGIAMRREFFSHLLQDETKITLFKSMELLHRYINSSENQAEP